MKTPEDKNKKIIELCLTVAEMRAKIETLEAQIKWYQETVKDMIHKEEK